MSRANLITVVSTIAAVILIVVSIRIGGRIGILEVIALAFSAVSVTMMIKGRSRPPE